MVYKLRNLATGNPYLVLPGTVSIGRNTKADIKLDHLSISRQHAVIYNTDDGIWIEDLGSSNGTLVRGKRITESTKIEIEELIRMGDLTFRLDPEVDKGAEGENNNVEKPEVPQISWERFQKRTDKVSIKEALADKRKTTAVQKVDESELKQENKNSEPDFSSESKSSRKRKGNGESEDLKLPIVLMLLSFGSGIAAGIMLGMFLAKLLFCS